MTSASASAPALAGVPDGLFIDGRWVEPAGARTLTSIRPSTGRPLREFAAGTVEDVDMAVRAARAALEGPWSTMRPHDRQSLILRFAELVDEHFDELTMLDVLDMGLPITPAGGWREVLQRGLRFYAAAALTIRGETIPHSMPAASGHYQAYTLKEPVGVVGAIASWNGPRWQTCKKFGATLATGCSS
jgi:aldehyde dehydrogenase (NAD+)